MSNLQDDEKDLFIKEKLNKDKLISKKYDDIFENFLKGDHEMEEEPKIKTKDENIKKQKKRWVKSFAAVAACALIFTGANVYASIQGYDNIFFLIKDLGNKKEIVAKKEDILTDIDTTISYTNIQLADGLFLQINKFVVKDGKASLFVTVNQEKASVIPDKFVVSSDSINLANETIQEKNQTIIAKNYDSNNNEYLSQYSYEIKLNNNYKDDMKILTLRIYDKNSVEIATLEIDLKNREIDLLSENKDTEIKKISEIDLKGKLGAYAIMLNPYTNSKPTDDDKFFLGISLVKKVSDEASKDDNDGFIYYSKEMINGALKEAIGEELGIKVNSEIFEYNKKLDAYRFIDPGEYISDGLCLNIDDLKFENEKYSVTFTYCLPDDQDYTNGTIEDLDRFKTTLEFTLNENETYTKYKVLNIDTAISEKVSTNTEENIENTSDNSTTTSTNHKHQYSVVESIGHTSLVGTHTVRCNICGEEHQEPHNFEKWYTIYNGTAWTLWCKDCKEYIYTEDYDVVAKSGYGMMDMEALENSDEDIFVSDNSPEYDISTIDNYASTMEWTEYWAPGIKFQYPTDWSLEEIDITGRNNRGANEGEVSTVINGIARGINRDTNEIIESEMEIDIFEPEYIENMTKEEYFRDVLGYNVDNVEDLAGYTMDKSGDWYIPSTETESSECIHFEEASDGSLWAYRITFCVYPKSNETNFKVLNIMNWFMGTIEITSY